MPRLENKIKKFLDNGIGYGTGNGHKGGIGYSVGDGYGTGFQDGNGHEDGNGNGDGYGTGDGNGNGNGFGYGVGIEDGSGFSCGSGSGRGDGIGGGYRNGNGLESINGKKVYNVDGVATLITFVKNNVAKGFILNVDTLTLEKTFIAKVDRHFAHGKTLKKALDDAISKSFDGMPVGERLDAFIEKFNDLEKKYLNSEFFEWHFRLTGSCEQGRENFVKNHQIDLDGESTVDEFIELTINDYGSSTIEKLKERYGL